jgi:hypothetical protein
MARTRRLSSSEGSRPGEQPDQALPQQEEVFADDDAHGTSTTMMVDPPGGLLTARMPSNVASLRSTPASPVPRAGSAPPRAVVGDHRTEHPRHVADLDTDQTGLGMLRHIGQRLGEK